MRQMGEGAHRGYARKFLGFVIALAARHGFRRSRRVAAARAMAAQRLLRARPGAPRRFPAVCAAHVNPQSLSSLLFWRFGVLAVQFREPPKESRRLPANATLVHGSTAEARRFTAPTSPSVTLANRSKSSVSAVSLAW
jgi:hypothetical protein